jgi:hypothetical protein
MKANEVEPAFLGLRLDQDAHPVDVDHQQPKGRLAQVVRQGGATE